MSASYDYYDREYRIKGDSIGADGAHNRKTPTKKYIKVRKASSKNPRSSKYKTKDMGDIASVLNTSILSRNSMMNNRAKKYAQTASDDKRSDEYDNSDIKRPKIMQNSRTDSETNTSDDSNSAANCDSTCAVDGVDDDANDDNDTASDDTHDSKKKKDKSAMPIKDAVKSAEDRARYASIKRFFRSNCSKEDVQLMVDIINKEHDVSLRTVNWFGTKHVATMPSRYRTLPDGRREIYDPEITYGSRLKKYRKKGFDPFRRGNAFEWPYDPDDRSKTVVTTLCQLQFFQWIFEYELIDYIIENLNSLKEMMRKSEKTKKDVKKKTESSYDGRDERSTGIGDTNDADTNSGMDDSVETAYKSKKNVKLKAKRSESDNQAKLVIKIG